MSKFMNTLVALSLTACAGTSFNVISVPALRETVPVPSTEDAADDPAIWVNLKNPAESLILGTDKQSGLYVYDLSGRERQALAIGALNNVDLRPFGDGAVAVASNDAANAISVFTIDGMTGDVTHIGNHPSGKIEPYGICMGKGALGGYTVAVTYKDGTVQLWTVNVQGAAVSARIDRTIALSSKLEGCVFDEDWNRLFIGEEAVGIWSLDLGDRAASPVPIDTISAGNGLVEDVEGLSIWRGSDGAGWLVASAQAADRFVIYDRKAPHLPAGIITISAGEGADAVSHTDGLDIVSANLGEAFPRGLLVVQDDSNTSPIARQNFKLVDWRDVETRLDLSSQ